MTRRVDATARQADCPAGRHAHCSADTDSFRHILSTKIDVILLHHDNDVIGRRLTDRSSRVAFFRFHFRCIMGNDGNYDMAITISWFPSCIWTTDIWIKI